MIARAEVEQDKRNRIIQWAKEELKQGGEDEAV
jgi:hypothetical protein